MNIYIYKSTYYKRYKKQYHTEQIRHKYTKYKYTLMSHLETLRKYTEAGPHDLKNINIAEDPQSFRSFMHDNLFDYEEWKKKINIKIQKQTKEVIEIDIEGIDPPIANALRRIMLSDIPTMAIEKVIIFQNTSIIQDEVLSHRLGLIPIQANPDDFTYVQNDGIITTGSTTNNEKSDEYNTTVMTLQILCTTNPQASLAAPPNIAYNNSIVYTKDLVWVPQGTQNIRIKEPIKPVHDDIIIAKLRPGQCIEAELHIQKGIGKQHAKWSPCATVFYRQIPHIEIVKPYINSEAKRLCQICPMNVFDIETIDNYQCAVVSKPRNCTMCRECIRDPEDQQRIRLLRRRNYFHCTYIYIYIFFLHVLYFIIYI